EVVFVGMNPSDRQLHDAAIKGGVKDTSGLIYRLKLGGTPQFALNEIFRHTTSIMRPNQPGFPSVLNMAASADGRRVAFIDLSSLDPNGRYNFAVFLLEGGQVRQMTNLKGSMRGLAISADGSTVAFGYDPAAGKTHELYILDVRSGAVQPMP